MINLNGTDIPSFVKVNNVEFSVLPTIENKLMKVRGKAGYYNLGQEMGRREFKVSLTIIAEQINGVMSATRELAEFLYSPEPVELRFGDEPDKYYMVLLDGDSNISEIVNVGQGEITFVCTEPYAYGTEHTVNYTPVDETPIDIDVQGNAEAHPLIELTMTADSEYISVISDDKHVTVGEIGQVSETPTDVRPTRLWDETSNTSLWTSASNVDGGSIQGTFGTNGYSFHQYNGDFGTDNTGWHGASMVRSLPAPIQDFEVQAGIGMTESQIKEVGRIEIYLLDENNEQFGKMALKETWDKGTSRWWEARAGKLAGGHYFASENRRGSVWGGNMKGLLKISRTGNKWWAWIGKYEPSLGEYRSRLTAEWFDTKGIATNKLAKIQIHIAGFKSFQPVNTMYVDDIKVFERLTLGTDEVPIIARKDDVITIDSERSIVLKNGEPFYEGLNPSSNFFSFKKGYQGLIVSPPVADVKVTYKERWL